jgi:hypothetical protein
MLGRAQSVKEPLNIYIIIRDYLIVEEIAVLSTYTWWGGRDACLAGMHADHVTATIFFFVLLDS